MVATEAARPGYSAENKKFQFQFKDICNLTPSKKKENIDSLF